MMGKLWRRFSADEKTMDNERDRIEIKLRYIPAHWSQQQNISSRQNGNMKVSKNI
jgi:hypothetical protein